MSGDALEQQPVARSLAACVFIDRITASEYGREDVPQLCFFTGAFYLLMNVFGDINNMHSNPEILAYT